MSEDRSQLQKQSLPKSVSSKTFLVLCIMLCWILKPVSSPPNVPQVGVALQDLTSSPNQTHVEVGPPMLLYPVGRVVRQGDRIFIDIFPKYAPALDGLSAYSHIWVIFWFHENDTPEKRAILKVHPRKDPANPLTGVFATRAPVRPNLIGLTCCRLLNIGGLRLEVEGLDAWPGTPVLDLKPYLPGSDSWPEAQVPGWARQGS